MPTRPILLPLRSAVESLNWPPVVVGAAGSLAALVSALDASQWLSTEELTERGHRQLEVLAQHFVRSSAGFARRMADAGLTPADLGKLGGLARLPPITRREVQLAGAGYCSPTIPKTHMPTGDVRTSGSTGEPLTVRRTSISNLMWMAHSIRDHLWHGRDFAARLATIRPNVPAVTRLDDWGAPTNLLFRTGAGLGLPISVAPDKQAAELRAFRPGSLLTYPNNLGLLMDALAERGGPWPELRHVRTISETVSPQLRDRVRSFFGLEIEDSYSAQEAGIIAIQCPDCGQYHVMAETLIVEVVDAEGVPCQPGEVGRILVTDFTNFATPIIRYEIGDYAEMGGVAECGRGLPTLRRILGRERNLIVMPDGSRRWPLSGYLGFPSIAQILQFQFVQVSRSEIEVNLVTAAPLDQWQEHDLREVITEALGHRFEISFHYFDGAIPRGANGKFEEFVCKIGAA